MPKKKAARPKTRADSKKCGAAPHFLYLSVISSEAKILIKLCPQEALQTFKQPAPEIGVCDKAEELIYRYRR